VYPRDPKKKVLPAPGKECDAPHGVGCVLGKACLLARAAGDCAGEHLTTSNRPVQVKGKDKTYYATKDILFLLHEPVLTKLRQIRAHNKKIIQAKAKKDAFRAKKLQERKPFYVLDHLVKERYPTFVDAVRDMDDALCLATLFATLPGTDTIESARTKNARRLVLEFSNYVVRARCLTKVFLSIKGCYLQAKVQGQDVTWLVPYEFGQNLPDDVDYRVMMTFLEFYETQLHFINYKLYGSLGLKYPPRADRGAETAFAGLGTLVLESKGAEGAPTLPAAVPAKATGQGAAGAGANKLKSLKKKLGSMERGGAGAGGGAGEGGEQDLDLAMGGDGGADEDGAGDGEEETLFSGLRFYLAREVPRALLELMVRAFGGTVGWEGDGSPFGAADAGITHHVVDRDAQRHQFLSREYVQPQWVADCINAGLLLPVAPYGPGQAPPPHVSPFVDDEEEGYIPEQRKLVLKLQAEAAGHAGAFEPSEGADAGGGGDGDGSGDEGAGEEEAEGDADAEAQFQAELEAEKAGAGAGDVPAVGGTRGSATARKRAREEVETERRRMMMPKKDKRLYDKIMFAKDRKAQRVEVLKQRK